MELPGTTHASHVRVDTAAHDSSWLLHAEDVMASHDVPPTETFTSSMVSPLPFLRHWSTLNASITNAPTPASAGVHLLPPPSTSFAHETSAFTDIEAQDAMILSAFLTADEEPEPVHLDTHQYGHAHAHDSGIDMHSMTSPMATSEFHSEFSSPVSSLCGPGSLAPTATDPLHYDYDRGHGHDCASLSDPLELISPSDAMLRRQLRHESARTHCATPGCRNRARVHGACKAHGATRLCLVPGCTKNAQSQGRCIRHGGGKRCSVDGCPRGAQARGKCKAHGGGVRCKVDGCTRSSQGAGLCRTHGGGKLCDSPGCKKGTQRGGKCSTHGGARVCLVSGCSKVDRGGGLCGRHKQQLGPQSV